MDCGETSVKAKSVVFPHTYRSGAYRSFARRDRVSDRQTSDRGGDKHQGLLFPNLLSSQEDREMAPSIRPFSLESLPGHPTIQNGVGSNNPEIVKSRPMGGQHRHQRCIPPCPDSSSVEKVPQAWISGQGLPIPSTSVWSGDRSLRLHSDHTVDGSHFSVERDSVPSLYRRLADSGRLTTADSETSLICPTVDNTIRLASQLGQIESDTQSEIRIHRRPVRPTGGISTSSFVQDREDKSSHQTRVVGDRYDRTSSTVSHWAASICGETSPLRTLLPTTNTMVPSPTVEHIDRSSRSDDHMGRSVERGTELVVKPQQCQQGYDTQRFCTGQEALHRRIRDCMGSSYGRSGAVREMDISRTAASHQCTRAESCDTCLRPVVQTYPEGDTLACLYRQHHGRSTYKQARGDQVPRPLLGGRIPDQVGVGKRSTDQGQTSARQAQCSSRRTIKTGPNSRDRVESVTAGIPEHLRGVWNAKHRPVCNVQEHQVADVCVTPSRERSPRHGRHVSELGQDVRLRIPTDRVYHRSPPQDSSVGLHGDTRSTLLSHSTVVSVAAQSASRSTEEVTSTSQTTQAAREGYFPRRRRQIIPTRVDVIQRSFQEAGFPRDVSHHLSRKTRSSSTRTYEAKWRVFARWCHGRRIDPLSAPLNDVLSFLCYLFDRLRLQPSTIEGYRAMLNPIFKARGIDLASQPVLSDLLAAFRTQRPRAAPALPEWDMAFVLYCLTRPPWEPLQEVSTKRLTLKTFFLLLLASGRRRSDLGAIDVTRIAYRADGSMILYPERGFAPKTKAAAEGAHAFSPIIVPDLTRFVGSRELDATLCPVRAVRLYVTRSNTYRKGRNRLFLSFQQSRNTNITTNTLSIWVKMLVRSVYTESGAESRDVFRISAHQIRHVAMSLASRVGTPLEAVVRAGMWTNANTFLDFYLSQSSELVAQTGRFRLGPIVAAQVTIPPQ